MNAKSYSALTLSAAAVTLCSVAVSGYLFFQNVGNRWAYLAATLVLVVGWMAQRFADDRRAVQTSILFAGLLLLISTLEKLANHAGLAMGADMDQRLLGVILGAVVVALSNAIPKKATSAQSFATQRMIGWALVLGGLGFAIAWLALPIAIAGDVAIVVLLLGLLIGVVAYARSWFVVVITVALSCITVVQAQTQDVSGAWHGTLQTTTGRYGLELLIQRRSDGTLSATLESIDQAPGEKIPVDVTVSDGDVKLSMNALGASYEGHLDKSSSAINGAWQQGTSLPLSFARGPMPTVPSISGLDGTWRAMLVRGATQLHLVLHVVTSQHGTRANLDSPDMGLMSLEVTDLAHPGDRVHFSVPIAQVAFNGSLNSAAEIHGTWQRDGQPPASVTFVREEQATPAASPHRADYITKAVRFPNPRANIVLAGTLTIPNDARQAPAVLLISGSGPEDRDETIFGQKPFATIADYLTRRGIIVLRYDDRGVGESTGTFADATIEDFASDANAAVAFLQARPEVDTHKIGLIGHSQGGVVGPLVAMHNKAIAYLVLLAAPATDMRELFLSQRRAAAVLQGEKESTIARAEPLLDQLYAATANAPNQASAQARISSMLTPEALAQLGVSPTLKDAVVGQLTGAWIRSLLRYDARATLQALTIPILALNGDLDRQVVAGENVAAIRAATAKNPNVTTRILPGLNHLFQPAHSGTMGEYAEIHEGFSPIVLSMIGDWIMTSALMANK